MADRYELEVRLAVAEGLVAQEEGDALTAEARRQHRSPLAILVERGRLSEQTFMSLVASTGETASLEEPAFAQATPRQRPAAAARRPGEPVAPVASWDRYANLRFLGQGGMGLVFLAFDPRLHREVAIKFVRGDDPEQVRRLIVEARAQARVSHERVCKVHEVGEVEGKVYIAMQYVAGKTLGELAGELTVEQKVMLLCGAAEGLHEAHRAGIIHRDVKPSNIMVERGERGELVPYVMDFGLARYVHGDGATVSGAVLGTPRYMAPEQARGDRQLDRRADVYGLGATLYHLLTGEPPIPGEALMEVMHHVIATEPRAPRAVRPELPVELEAVVLKCLEKAPSARYDSARALAEDLRRFLDGEPVRARPAGRWARARRRLAKHRRIVAVGAAALIALLIAVGWGVQARREASERERLARRFTEQVERVEAMARYAALSPRHDLRGDQAALRARMTELAAEIHRGGELAAGPGCYALGRGYLALEDPAAARVQLEQAWQRGFREPRVAYALALVMGRLYQQQLLAAERLETKPLRAARKREVEQQYRAPALRYLDASHGAEAPLPHYVAALRAYYQGHLEEALHHLEALGGGPPWFYEAPELRGDILLARGLSRRDQGETEDARRDFAAGRAAYAAAAAIGESATGVYQSLAELEYAALVLELYGEGEIAAPFERALAASTRALELSPESYPARVLRARTHRSLAEHEASAGKDITAPLTAAVADAEHAIALAPRLPQARVELARIYRQWGEARQGRNEDPGPQLQRAVAASEQLDAADRDGVYYGNLGLVFSVWADYQDQVGRDSQVNRSKSIEAYAHALQLNDQLGDVWINLGINYFMRASLPGSRIADDDLAQALHALDQARAINPAHVVPLFYLGEIHERLAERQRARGQDPAPARERALAAYRAGVAINPRIPHLHNGLGLALMEQARAAWDHGADPEPLLTEAQAAFDQAIAVAPEQGFGYNNLGDLHALRAAYRLARDQDPGASVTAAVQVLQQAIERIPKHSTFWATLGMAHTLRAAYLVEHGRDPQPSLAAATTALRRALELNPANASAQRTLGEALGLEARLRARRAPPRSTDFDEAAQAFQRALELAPDLPEPLVAFAQLCRTWAIVLGEARQDPAPVLQRGLALVERALAARPSWPEARALRAGLRLVQAQHTRERSAQQVLAAAATADFDLALGANPALEPRWRSQAQQAAQLAGR